MEQFSLADNFERYFSIRFAKTAALREQAFQIRHQVYAEELQWEPPRPTGMETDEFDDFAHTCLLEHKASGQFAGTVRLVIPPVNNCAHPLPFERNDSHIWHQVIDPKRLERGSFSEISRMAVPADFRRRSNEQGKPFVLDEHSSRRAFTEEERRNFPNIAIGLYMASIALVDICHHQCVFVLMEPRLRRHLARFGLPFEQAGDTFEHHGARAIYYLSRNRLTRFFTPEINALYQRIKSTLEQQLTLMPYTPNYH